jgi:predicted Zn-dependent peptidase
VDYLKLENGFDVVLKKRTQAHAVSVRLVVNVGLRNFPCDKRETPHFLEHLLFMGTSQHNEAELQRLIEDHGGTWNGQTLPTETRYQIDIFDKHLSVAINTLYEMMTDTVVTPNTVESARAVIHRERMGKLSKLVEWAYEKGLFKDASTKAGELLLPGTGVFCPGVVTPEGIEESDVKDAYQNYYVPSNMTLVVVGNFDRASLGSQIKGTFGQMASRGMNGAKIATPPHMTGSKEVTGTLSPLVGSNGVVGVAYRTDGFKSNSSDYYTLWVLWRYLQRVLYEKIRVEKALSYSPGSVYAAQEDFGLFVVSADVNLEKLESVKALLQAEVEKVKQGHIESEDIEVAKRRMLLERAQEYESNASMAIYYVQHRHELKTHGKLINDAASIVGVTPEDIRRVANKYLRDDARIVIRSTPTFTYTQFVLLLSVLLIGVPGTGFYLLRRFVKRRRARTRS